eukprot:TRINITY_DN8718_c0_g1_i1.p1 TRINITY_DN8718_c0_g1~~TRINITY_DN8718_c0_g1_i1.p1  ORF type:complete len:234 (-),score=31.34 TRINITY_DN8718_c0_g1_i1:63-764(-)
MNHKNATVAILTTLIALTIATDIVRISLDKPGRGSWSLVNYIFEGSYSYVIDAQDLAVGAPVWVGLTQKGNNDIFLHMYIHKNQLPTPKDYLYKASTQGKGQVVVSLPIVTDGNWFITVELSKKPGLFDSLEFILEVTKTENLSAQGVLNNLTIWTYLLTGLSVVCGLYIGFRSYRKYAKKNRLHLERESLRTLVKDKPVSFLNKTKLVALNDKDRLSKIENVDSYTKKNQTN